MARLLIGQIASALSLLCLCISMSLFAHEIAHLLVVAALGTLVKLVLLREPAALLFMELFRHIFCNNFKHYDPQNVSFSIVQAVV